MNIRLVATDLDGTFLRNDRTISRDNLEALHMLGSRNIIRVVATGRNLQKVHSVIHREVPFDYIVYSSGAGIYNWKEQKHIFKQNMAGESSGKLLGYLISKKYNFYASGAAPENHNLWFHKGEKDCSEFNLYLHLHCDYAKPLPDGGMENAEICQFLLIIPEDEAIFVELKNEIESLCPKIRVIRSSSPVTKGYIWVEVFDSFVSKGNGVKMICDMLGILPGETLGIGNDYNDLDLLNFTACSYITENAPCQIKQMFIPAPSNEENGFANAVRNLL